MYSGIIAAAKAAADAESHRPHLERAASKDSSRPNLEKANSKDSNYSNG